jgi:hypothetical protein
MNLITESYQAQVARWPRAGRHILAQFDSDSIVAYQAYRPSIGRFAAEHGYFGGEFSFTRMSWIKPNFLWMMYRCGWGTKPEQEVVLAVRLRRTGFEELLAQTVPSRFDPALHEAPRRSSGAPSSSASAARRCAATPANGSSISRTSPPFIAEQRAHLSQPAWPQLVTPREQVYTVTDRTMAQRLGLSPEE